MSLKNTIYHWNFIDGDMNGDQLARAFLDFTSTPEGIIYENLVRTGFALPKIGNTNEMQLFTGFHGIYVIK